MNTIQEVKGKTPKITKEREEGHMLRKYRDRTQT
jgi:hypothetical protein